MCSVPAGPAVPLSEATSLSGARDRDRHSPHDWLATAIARAAPRVELRVSARHHDGTLELRRAGSETAIAAHHGRLPLRTSSLGAVALDMCLPSLPGLDPLFSELRRVLRPTGTIAALVPSRPGWSPTELRVWWPLHRALGGRPRFRHESARDQLHWLAAAADFTVLTDERRTFALPVPDAASARCVVHGLVVDGVWPPDLEPSRLDLACDALARYAGPGRTLPVPLRLLVARR
jgi:SAM-dependent methyltransferase